MLVCYLQWVDRYCGRQWQRNRVHVKWKGAVLGSSISQVEQLIVESLLKLQHFNLVYCWIVKVVPYFNACHITTMTVLRLLAGGDTIFSDELLPNLWKWTNQFWFQLAQVVHGQEHEMINFDTQEVKGPYHTRPWKHQEAWPRHHSWPSWVEQAF